MPAHQFPTGTVLRGDRRRALVQWARTGGRYVIEDDYDAEFRYDRVAVRALQGLDPDNSNAYDRGIVMHSAWYAAPDMLTRWGKLGRSEGCFAVAEHMLPQVVGLLGSGRMLYSDKV